MTEHGITSPSQALTKIVSHIDKLSPQCPPDFRQDAHKLSFLRAAVIGKPWAKVPITKADSGGISWNEFVTDLHAAISLETEMNTFGAPSSIHHANSYDEKAYEDIHYGRYGRNPRFVRKHPPRNYQSNDTRRSTPVDNQPGLMSLREARERGLCRRCLKPYSKGHTCDKSRIRENIFDRMRRG